jgi:hypothetical protein
MKKIEVFQADLIHWDYNDLNIDWKQVNHEVKFMYFILREDATNKKSGLKFRWTLRLFSDKEDILSCIVEDVFKIKEIDIQTLTLAEFKTIINKSFSQFKETLEKKLGVSGYNISIITLDQDDDKFQELLEKVKS